MSLSWWDPSRHIILCFRWSYWRQAIWSVQHSYIFLSNHIYNGQYHFNFFTFRCILIDGSLTYLFSSFCDCKVKVFKFQKWDQRSHPLSFQLYLLFWSLMLQKVTSVPLVTSSKMVFSVLPRIKMLADLSLCHKSHQSVYIYPQISFKCKETSSAETQTPRGSLTAACRLFQSLTAACRNSWWKKGRKESVDDLFNEVFLLICQRWCVFAQLAWVEN